MNQTIEKLTARDKAALSKETILAWYRAKNREKLDNLKDEIKQLAYSDREKLRKIIIENTKKELEKQHKNLTADQRDLQAKQFADEFIKAIMGKESIEDVVKRYETISKSGGREALAKKWMNNNPRGKIEAIQDDPKYLALRDIVEPNQRAEICMMMYFIEKFMGGRKKALEIYNEFSKGNTFKLSKLKTYFSRSLTEGKLGFYYGTRKVKWHPEPGGRDLYSINYFKDLKVINPKTLKAEKTGWALKKAWRRGETFNVNVTGWWAHDISDDESKGGNVSVKGGADFDKDILGKDGKLRKAGYGDEWLGKNLMEAVKNIPKELFGTQRKAQAGDIDSGLDAGEEQKILDAIKETKDLSNTIYKEKASEEMYKWFSANAVNKWVKLEEKEYGLMTFLFGEGCGSYFYRYSPKKDRVYLIRIDGAKVDAKHFGGRITVKNKALDTWESYDKKNTEKLLDYIADNLTAQEVNSELLDYKIKEESPEKITLDDKLEKTKGLTGAFFGVKNVEYENIEKDYVEKLTEKLKAELEKRGMEKEKATEFAELRAAHIKAEIYRVIEANEVIENARKENSKVKLEIKVDSNDKVAVRLADLSLARKIKGDMKRKADAKFSPESLENDYMKQLEKRVEKYAGRFTPFVMYFIDKFFKVKDKVKDMVSGKPSLFTAALSFLGFKTGKDIISQRKVNEKAFEKIPPADKKSYSLTKKMVFDGDIILKNKRIIIPKGKGFIPGGKIKLKLDSRYTVEYDPQKEKEAALKKQTGFKGIFDRLKASKEKYKDNEVTIEAGTVVPSKTEIPKGSKIERV